MPAELVSGFFGSTAEGERWAAWHNLGTTIDRPVVNTAEAITLAGLDWNVISVPLSVTMPDGSLVTSERDVVQVREDTSQILGVTTTTYQSVSNVERFAFMDDLLDSDEAKWHTAGVLQDSRRVWMLAKLSESIKIAGMTDEAVDMYLLLQDGTCGNSSLKIAVTPIRVVCMNTLNYALSTTPRMWVARHTASLTGRMQEARDTLKLTHAYTTELEAMGNQLVSQKMSTSDFRSFLGQLMPLPTLTPDSTTGDERSWNTIAEKRDAITAIYRTADNLANVRGTKWAALQAVGEWNDWATRRSTVSAESAWTRRMTPTTIKDSALAILTS